ncbi:MAG: hypothetical protein IKS14_08365, partial [Thermoguttaceae bacterium]|nr:hypothetical protein [Thermoguttaceae bacterium]
MKQLCVKIALAVIAPMLLAACACAPAGAQDYSVDFGQKVGAIKKLNGANIWARMSSSRGNDALRKDAEACHFST